MATVMVLERELEFYKRKLEEWLPQLEGKFALVKGEELIGTFTKAEEAYEEGVTRFGKEAFLIKQVSRDEPQERMPALFLGLPNARLL